MITRLRFVALALVGAFLAVLPSLAPMGHAQGWWWGSPINPGFDRDTVIQVTGIVTEVNLVTWGGPSTLRLHTSDQNFAVVLAPGWYLAEVHADIQHGDQLSVEGSKMLDRKENLYLVAARIRNWRTDSILELRDKSGLPLWMPRRPADQMHR